MKEGLQFEWVKVKEKFENWNWVKKKLHVEDYKVREEIKHDELY